MTRTRQHIHIDWPLWQSRMIGGIPITQEDTQWFLAAYEGLEQAVETLRFYLRKLYLSTRAGIESNITLLVEQALERQLEKEQFSVGWENEG